MTNKEKFLALVSKEKTTTLEKINQRKQNRAMLRESQNIALKVLMRLDELNWTQKQLAEQLQVSSQYISKLVKGKENLTLDTIVKIQSILEIPLLASFMENKVEEIMSIYKVEITQDFSSSDKLNICIQPYEQTVIQMTHKVEPSEYDYFPLAN